MKILITNDDGIRAEGIRALARELSPEHQVTVVAPDRERSACSHSLTIHHPIRYQQVDDWMPGVRAYAVDGTPVDCVKLALIRLLDYDVDLVLSGINNGPNLGSDVLYSGTVAAALEAAYMGKRAIATSLTDWNCDAAEYTRAAKHFCSILSDIVLYDLPKFTALNVNFPAHMPYVGRFWPAELGINIYSDRFVETDSTGLAVKLTGDPIPHNPVLSTSDVALVAGGRVTLTPIKIDRTDYAVLQRLRQEDAR